MIDKRIIIVIFIIVVFSLCSMTNRLVKFFALANLERIK